MAIKEASPKQTKRIVLFFSLIPLVFILIGLNMLVKGYQSYSWDEVGARIVESRIETSRDSEGDDTYNVSVKYEYQINGQTYSSDRLSTGFHPYNSADWNDAEAYRKMFETGTQLSVYYDPQEPAEATIIRGIHWAMYLFIFVPMVFLFFMVRLWRGKQGLQIVSES